MNDMGFAFSQNEIAWDCILSQRNSMGLPLFAFTDNREETKQYTDWFGYQFHYGVYMFLINYEAAFLGSQSHHQQVNYLICTLDIGLCLYIKQISPLLFSLVPHSRRVFDYVKKVDQRKWIWNLDWKLVLVSPSLTVALPVGASCEYVEEKLIFRIFWSPETEKWFMELPQGCTEFIHAELKETGIKNTWKT